ncbi:MAG: SH3 domain-containing protein [Treponema sp.]|nr:SH3 domain-containing protein [Treponema sp.]
MKKLIVLLVVCCLAVPLFSASKAKTQYVAIDPAPLKAKPAASSKKVGTAEYASAVLVLKEEKSWVYVQLVSDKSVEGWLPASALTSKKIKEKVDATSANADEIALAGKGFNSTIEAVYAEQYEMNFSVVDYIESLGAQQEEAIAFAQEGQLNDGGAE